MFKNFYFIDYFRYYYCFLVHFHMRQRAPRMENHLVHRDPILWVHMFCIVRVSPSPTTRVNAVVTWRIWIVVVSAFPRTPPPPPAAPLWYRCAPIHQPRHAVSFEYIKRRSITIRLDWYKRHDKWHSQITEHTRVQLPAVIQRWLWRIVKNKNQCHEYPIQFFPLRARNCRFFFTTPEYGLEHKCASNDRMVKTRTAYALPMLLPINVNFTWFFFSQTTWIYDEKITSRAYIRSATLDVFIANKFTLIQQLLGIWVAVSMTPNTHMKWLGPEWQLHTLFILCTALDAINGAKKQAVPEQKKKKITPTSHSGRIGQHQFDGVGEHKRDLMANSCDQFQN